MATVFGLLLVASSLNAFACRYVPQKPESYVAQASYVFIARITALREQKNTNQTSSVRAEFDIKQVLKGDPNNLRFLNSGYGFGDCGVTFAIGKQYLIFTNDEGTVMLTGGSREIIPENERHKIFIQEIANYVKSGIRIKTQFRDLHKPLVKHEKAKSRGRKQRTSAVGGPRHDLPAHKPKRKKLPQAKPASPEPANKLQVLH